MRKRGERSPARSYYMSLEDVPPFQHLFCTPLLGDPQGGPSEVLVQGAVVRRSSQGAKCDPQSLWGPILTGSSALAGMSDQLWSNVTHRLLRLMASAGLCWEIFSGVKR